MSAAGKVLTGFSKPYVALYSCENGTVTYTSGQVLARGVEVSIEPTTSDSNIFYADNVAAESAGGTFTGGSFTLTVDGLHTAAEKLIMGLPTAATDGWTAYGDDQKVPKCGIGYIARYTSDGVESFVPTVLACTTFDQIKSSAKTQESEINWQTSALSGKILRSEDSKHNWKFVGAEVATEALAEAALKTKLGIA